MSGEDRAAGRKNGVKTAGGVAPSSSPPSGSAPPDPPGEPPGPPPGAPVPLTEPAAAVTASTIVSSPAPRPQRFLFVSKWGLIHDLAWEVKKEGNEVRYHIMMKSEKDVGDGFVDKVDRWEDLKDWADVIVFDDCEFGALAERLRAEGKAVVGGSPYTDRLEMDRDFGQEEMRAAGLTILPRWVAPVSEAIPLTYFLDYFRHFYGFKPTFSHVLAKGFILVFVYLLLEIFLMKAALRKAKKTGLLLKLSE